MMGETAGAVLSRAIATDHAMRRVPRPSEAVIIAETLDTMTDSANEYLTLQDVADRLRLSLHTVRDHERRGILPASRLGRRVRVSPDQFAEYIRRLEARGAGAAVEDLPTGGDLDARIEEAILHAIAAGRFDDRIREIVRRVLADRPGSPGQ